MSKLDKLLEVAAPVAKEAAKGSVKLTGKGLKLAEKGIKRAGDKAAEIHKENNDEKIRERLRAIREIIPDCQFFFAFEATHFNKHKLNSMGLKLKYMDIDHMMRFIFDEAENVQYKIDEHYDSMFRSSVLSDRDGAIGSIHAHRRIMSSERESLHLRGQYLFDLDSKYDNGFNITDLVAVWSEYGGYRIIKNGMVAMDVSKYKDRDILAIADPQFIEIGLLIYAAVCLRSHPKPDPHAGGRMRTVSLETHNR